MKDEVFTIHKIKNNANAEGTAVPLSVINDRSLSMEAKGIYAYMLSRQEDGPITLEDLKNRSAEDSPKEIKEALNQLVNKGLVNQFIPFASFDVTGFYYEINKEA